MLLGTKKVLLPYKAKFLFYIKERIAEWSKAVDCKSIRV